MDAKTYLSQVLDLENELFRKKEKRIMLEAKMEYSSPISDGVGSGNSVQYTVDKIPIQIAIIEELDEDIKRIETLIKIKTVEVLQTIDSIPDADIVEVLYLRYLRKTAINIIATKLGRSNKWVYEKHNKGLNKVQIMLINQSMN